MSPAMQGKLSAYQSVAAHGGVAAADPHKLIMMLLDGALTRIAQAKVCGERGEKIAKSTHLQRALAIIGELRASLDLSQGPLARNLDDLYDYITRQLLIGQATSDPKVLTGASSILVEIRGAWAALPVEARAARAAV